MFYAFPPVGHFYCWRHYVFGSSVCALVHLSVRASRSLPACYITNRSREFHQIFSFAAAEDKMCWLDLVIEKPKVEVVARPNMIKKYFCWQFELDWMTWYGWWLCNFGQNAIKGQRSRARPDQIWSKRRKHIHWRITCLHVVTLKRLCTTSSW